jgi:allantoinase
MKTHNRFDFCAINNRPDYSWPDGKRLAVYIGLNLEHFSFGEGLGACLAPPQPQPDVLNYSWREYGNRVGAWRMLDLFSEFQLRCAALVNTSLLDHCPGLVTACARRGHEIVGHGRTNAERQGDMSEAQETALLKSCRQRFAQAGQPVPSGWLSPWISETVNTPDLLAESGYRYTLNWCHDDQPVRMSMRSRATLWSIPYPQELNDIPMVIGRSMNGKDFAEMIVDQYEEMLRQASDRSLVMGIAVHPYIMGQPYRLRHLRKALEHLTGDRGRAAVWWTTPGEICEWVDI